MKTVDIVLPAYNEEAGLRVFHATLMQVLTPLQSKYIFKIIYVLDRSTDNSLDVLTQLAAKHPNVTILHLSKRFGHQMSLVAGIDHSSGDAVIMMDCDLQHPPQLIPVLLDQFEAGFDIVHTVRTYGGKTSLARKIASSFFYHFQNELSPVELQEGAADFRLISRKVARVFQTQIREHDQFLRGLFKWVGFSSTFVSFVSPPRFAGKTKYDLRRLATFFVLGMISFSKVPLRIASFIGFFISCMSLLYGVYLIGVFFRVRHLPAGYTSLIVVSLFMGGLQLTVLGMIGEYLGHVFDETKKRPLYIVDQVVAGKLNE
jgi:dolichol-phosphate mannosyltransferase